MKWSWSEVKSSLTGRPSKYVSRTPTPTQTPIPIIACGKSCVLTAHPTTPMQTLRRAVLDITLPSLNKWGDVTGVESVLFLGSQPLPEETLVGQLPTGAVLHLHFRLDEVLGKGQWRRITSSSPHTRESVSPGSTNGVSHETQWEDRSPSPVMGSHTHMEGVSGVTAFPPRSLLGAHKVSSMALTYPHTAATAVGPWPLPTNGRGMRWSDTKECVYRVCGVSARADEHTHPKQAAEKEEKEEAEEEEEEKRRKGLEDTQCISVTVHLDGDEGGGLPRTRTLRVPRDYPIGTLRELFGLDKSQPIIMDNRTVENEGQTFEELCVSSQRSFRFGAASSPADLIRRASGGMNSVAPQGNRTILEESISPIQGDNEEDHPYHYPRQGPPQQPPRQHHITRREEKEVQIFSPHLTEQSLWWEPKSPLRSKEANETLNDSAREFPLLEEVPTPHRERVKEEDESEEKTPLMPPMMTETLPPHKPSLPRRPTQREGPHAQPQPKAPMESPFVSPPSPLPFHFTPPPFESLSDANHASRMAATHSIESRTNPNHHPTKQERRHMNNPHKKSHGHDGSHLPQTPSQTPPCSSGEGSPHGSSLDPTQQLRRRATALLALPPMSNLRGYDFNEEAFRHTGGEPMRQDSDHTLSPLMSGRMEGPNLSPRDFPSHPYTKARGVELGEKGTEVFGRCRREPWRSLPFALLPPPPRRGGEEESFGQTLPNHWVDTTETAGLTIQDARLHIIGGVPVEPFGHEMTQQDTENANECHWDTEEMETSLEVMADGATRVTPRPVSILSRTSPRCSPPIPTIGWHRRRHGVPQRGSDASAFGSPSCVLPRTLRITIVDPHHTDRCHCNVRVEANSPVGVICQWFLTPEEMLERWFVCCGGEIVSRSHIVTFADVIGGRNDCVFSLMRFSGQQVEGNTLIRPRTPVMAATLDEQQEK